MKTENKIISALLILSIMLSIFMPIISKAYTIDEGITFSLTSDATEIKAEGQIVVTLNMDLAEGRSVDTFSGILQYDNSILRLNEDLISTNSTTKWDFPAYVDNNGKVQIEAGRQRGESIEGPMFVFGFDVIKDATSTLISIEGTEDNDRLINCAYLGTDYYCEGTSLQIPKASSVYTITYNKNTTDTVDNMPSVESKIEGIDYTIAQTPTRIGYTFEGWNTQEDGNGTAYAAGSTYSIDADLNLYAQWTPIETTLTVNPNGGIWEGKSETQVITQAYGTTKIINNPTGTPNGYIVRFNPNGGITDTLQQTQTTTFSNWTLSGGGTLEGTKYTFADTTATVTANYTGDSITLPSATKTGATFKGWYTSSTAGTRVGGEGEEYTPTTTTTLFAQWEEIEYTLTVNPNGGTWNGTTSTSEVKGNYEDTTPITNPTAPKGYTVTLNNDGTTTEKVQTTTFNEWIATGKGSINGIVYTFGEGNGQLTATYTPNLVELETPTKVGYTFDGWYTLQTGGTKVNSPYTPTENVTLYAHWTANKYQITFNPGSGTTSTTQKEVTYGQTYGTLPTPTRPGYDFNGWYNPEEERITENDIVNITEDSTLTAEWLGAEYTVTFNPGDGDLGSQPASKTVRNEGTYGELPTPTREGYTFKGWYDESNNKIESTTTVNIISNTTLTAQWEAVKTTLIVNPNGGTWNGTTSTSEVKGNYEDTTEITNPVAPNGYVVTFNPNGGTTDTLQQTQTTTFEKWTKLDGTDFIGTTYTFGTENETLTAQYIIGSLTLPAATKTGATFKGWYTAATGGTRVGGTGDEYISTATTTLFAQWEKIEYTLTVNPNGGTWDGTTSTSEVKGNYEDTTEITNPVAPNGYTVTLNNDGTTIEKSQTTTFNGWTLTGAGNIEGTTYTFGTDNGILTATYTPNSVELETPTKVGYTFDGWYTLQTGGTKVNSSYTPTENVTLYAQWTANKYQITFNPGSGTTSTTQKEVTYGQTYGTLPTPTRPGYDFNGWYNPEEERITENDIVNIIEDTTLTAKWLGAEYTVTFNPGDGDLGSQPASKTVRNEGTYGELPTPTREGYTFKGWYDESNNKIESTTTVNLESDTTLTAQWEANVYTITFDPGTNGTVSEPSRQVTYGQTYGTLPIPTRPGYVFNGWYDPDGNKIEETDVIAILADTTLTAVWEGAEYTLTFDYDGGNGETPSKTIKNEEQYGELPTATKEGYTFKGWYYGDNKVEETTIVNITSDITLKAKYEINKYTVTLKNDDGTIITTLTVEYGNNALYTETPVKTNVPAGYKATFTGWDNPTKLQNVTENITVTATYTISPINYKIIYNNLKDSDNSANPTQYTVEDENITLVNLPNQGKYIFKGWFTANDETGEKVESIDTSKLGNIVLYAHWENDSLYLSSEKYKIGENDIDNYEQGDIYLDKIEPKTTVTQLIENCDTNGTITVIDKDGQILDKDDLVGTEMTIKVTRYDEEISITAVVMGDLDGNGLVTATDLSTLNQKILKTIEINDAVFKAADLDDNKKITATDLSTVNNVILKNITLTYDKNYKISKGL